MVGYTLQTLGEAPESPGVYSWYYRLELSDRDIDECLTELASLSDDVQKQAVVAAFLEARLFVHYKEQPYHVSITGPLKPTYEGDVPNAATISDSLLRRLAEFPGRIRDLKRLLYDAVPAFASPIYIGLSGNLRTRLLGHRRLIERYNEAIAQGLDYGPGTSETDSPESRRDHSFAREVTVLRRFSTSDLIVYVMPCEVPDTGVITDLENLLNRINYPLCGRR